MHFKFFLEMVRKRPGLKSTAVESKVYQQLDFWQICPKAETKIKNCPTEILAGLNKPALRNRVLT